MSTGVCLLRNVLTPSIDILGSMLVHLTAARSCSFRNIIRTYRCAVLFFYLRCFPFQKPSCSLDRNLPAECHSRCTACIWPLLGGSFVFVRSSSAPTRHCDPEGRCSHCLYFISDDFCGHKSPLHPFWTLQLMSCRAKWPRRTQGGGTGRVALLDAAGTWILYTVSLRS